MAQENYVERCYMQRLPLLEPNGFFFWKDRFETYVKSKDIDLWQVIQNGDFYFEVQDKETKLIKEMPYELLKDVQKKQLGSLAYTYHHSPRKFTSEEFNTDLLTQEYERFSVSNEEIIDSGFTRFNAIVMTIEEAKDLSTLPLGELIGNLKVYEMVLDNDRVALKRKVRDKGGKSSRRERECYNYGSMNHLASNCPKPNNKAFVSVTWSDSEDDDEPQNNTTCLMAIDSQEAQHSRGLNEDILKDFCSEDLYDVSIRVWWMGCFVVVLWGRCDGWGGSARWGSVGLKELNIGMGEGGEWGA
ncbi:zf-CCHC domain-containing protein [Tanacetum coccineum]